jgi:hypothetical protein
VIEQDLEIFRRRPTLSGIQAALVLFSDLTRRSHSGDVPILEGQGISSSTVLPFARMRRQLLNLKTNGIFQEALGVRGTILYETITPYLAAKCGDIASPMAEVVRPLQGRAKFGGRFWKSHRDKETYEL